MAAEPYLSWVARETATCWWHDSAEPVEVDWAIEHGAVGATTNPYLSHLALAGDRARWAAEIRAACSGARGGAPASTGSAAGCAKAEALMRLPVGDAAQKFRPIFDRTGGRDGWVCAQVNPARAGDRGPMLEMARRFAAWGSNVTVKLPATAAGLDVLEDCVADGITTTATVSFTVPQVIAVAERHRAGIARAKAAGVRPGGCFAVLMVGRLDDYLREVAHDSRAAVSEDDIQTAGVAVAKRAAAIFRERRYEAGLIVAAFRGLHHMTELVGGRLIMSIAKAYQAPLLSDQIPKESRIDRPVDSAVIGRLMTMPEFARAYEPDGMAAEQFMAYGLTQRTLAFFAEAGWKLMEAFKESPEC